jgi:hypothetical protein
MGLLRRVPSPITAGTHRGEGLTSSVNSFLYMRMPTLKERLDGSFTTDSSAIDGLALDGSRSGRNERYCANVSRASHELLVGSGVSAKLTCFRRKFPREDILPGIAITASQACVSRRELRVQLHRSFQALMY